MRIRRVHIKELNTFESQSGRNKKSKENRFSNNPTKCNKGKLRDATHHTRQRLYQKKKKKIKIDKYYFESI